MMQLCHRSRILKIRKLARRKRFHQLARLGKSIYNHFHRSKLPWRVLSKSVEGRMIYQLEFGSGDEITIIFGCFHGDELGSAKMVMKLANYLYDIGYTSDSSKVILIPVVNPDGLIRGQRTNANGIDLNRNFPTKDWRQSFKSGRYFPGIKPSSEIETRTIIDLIKTLRPAKIISIHSPLKTLNYDGPALELANEMAGYIDYPVQSYIGYETPGSFGTYAGKEKNIAVISYELSHASLRANWQKHLNALMSAVRFKQKY